jgi:hypothetical protein
VWSHTTIAVGVFSIGIPMRHYQVISVDQFRRLDIRWQECTVHVHSDVECIDSKPVLKLSSLAAVRAVAIHSDSTNLSPVH